MKNHITRLKKVYKFAEEFMQENTNWEYHNFRHAKDVAHAAIRLANGEGVSSQEKFELITASLLHDLVVESNNEYNEEQSSEIAEKILLQIGYSSKELGSISKLILATKLPTCPSDKIEEIICDADADNLGREDFLERGEEIRKELGIPEGKNWYQNQIEFLKKHYYYTKTAQELRGEGLQKNMKELEKLMEVI